MLSGEACVALADAGGGAGASVGAELVCAFNGAVVVVPVGLAVADGEGRVQVAFTVGAAVGAAFAEEVAARGVRLGGVVVHRAFGAVVAAKPRRGAHTVALVVAVASSVAGRIVVAVLVAEALREVLR